MPTSKYHLTSKPLWPHDNECTIVIHSADLVGIVLTVKQPRCARLRYFTIEQTGQTDSRLTSCKCTGTSEIEDILRSTERP